MAAGIRTTQENRPDQVTHAVQMIAKHEWTAADAAHRLRVGYITIGALLRAIASEAVNDRAKCL